MTIRSNCGPDPESDQRKEHLLTKDQKEVLDEMEYIIIEGILQAFEEDEDERKHTSSSD